MNDADREEQARQADEAERVEEQREQANRVTREKIVAWFRRQNHSSIDPETVKSTHYQLGYMQGALATVLNNPSVADRYRAEILEDL